MPKTIIYDPKLSPLIPRSSVYVPVEAISSPIRFARTIVRPGKKTTALDAVETRGFWIVPGTNFDIPDEDYDHICKHPTGSALLSSGAIKVILPTLEEGQPFTETTKDYSELNALDLVRNSSDLEWLERSEKKEDRPAVLKVLIEQVKSIKSLNTKG